MDTALITIPALETEEPVEPDNSSEGYVRAEHFDLNTAKANGDLGLIEDIENDYVQITFTQNNQSYLVCSESWSSNATSCLIRVEDLIVEDEFGNVITKPNYVGFYNRTYSQKVDQYRIVDNEKIREINRDYRNKDAVTDVISFAFEEVNDVEYTDIRFLGEIYISYERCVSQAEDYGHSVKREFCYLAVHGLLHLLGYDHMTDEDKKEMRTLEEEILSEYDIKR